MSSNGLVHLVFKTPLDVGFADLAANVVEKYFTEYIPAALDTADALRDSGSDDQFIWTTGAWLLCEYLEQATASEQRRVESAIAVGDQTWHAMPCCAKTRPDFRMCFQQKHVRVEFGTTM